MIYPYSQHDIPPTRDYLLNRFYSHHSPQAIVSGEPENHYQSQHYRTHTSVEIQPSHSYEIKETSNGGYKTLYGDEEQQHTPEYRHPHSDVEAEPVPVIVLRVPGPAKYASHLQALLQQYLEVRAAQYLQVLQEQEAAGHSAVDVQSEAYHQSDGVEHAYAAPSVDYNAADEQNYQQQHSVETPAVQAEEQVYQETDAVAPVADDEQNAGYEYPRPQDEQQEHIVYNAQSHQSVSEPNLLTTENFPDSRHTQVLFKSTTQEPNFNYGAPSEHEHESPAQVQSYPAPLVYHKFEQFYDDQSSVSYGNVGMSDEHQHQQQSNYDSEASVSPQNFVTITQRPILPHNYHAQIQQSNQYSNYNSDEHGHGHDYEAAYNTNNVYKRSFNTRRNSRSNVSNDNNKRQQKFTNLMQRFRGRQTAADVKLTSQ